MGQAGLIIKATRLCNLRCAYCHDWRTGKDQTMTFPVLARLLAAALRDPTHDAVDFIWHGGETTVLPMTFYQKAMLVQARYRRPGQLITNIIQTNATRLTDDWVRFLRQYDFSVGVSLDGPPALHDRYRRFASGRPSFDVVARGIRRLQAAGVSFIVLMVIDEGALELGADHVFDFMLEFGIKHIGLIAAKPTNQPDAPPNTPTAHYADPGRFTAFLMRMFDRWQEHGDPTIRIRELNGIRNRLVGNRPGLCTLAGGCLGNYYLIEPNGDVAHCDLFLGDPRYTLGNIMRDDFATIRSSPRLAELQAANQRALDAMRSCPEFGVCNGWCPHERYLSARHNPNHSSACCGLKDLIGHVRSRVASATPERRLLPMAAR